MWLLQVCFSDKSYFECHDAYQPKVWHKIGYLKPNMPTDKHPNKVMIWSVMSDQGVGRIHIVKGMMNSQKYISILHDHLLLQLEQWCPDGNAIFMQDRAPCHTSMACMTFLATNQVPVLPWPGSSPDLNLIEMLWAIIKRHLLGKIIKIFLMKDDMINALIAVWFHNNTILDICKKLIYSMLTSIEL